MMAERVVARARLVYKAFGVKCSKFAGAATVEILKDALPAESIPTSPRDVFVRGIPVEIGLVVPSNGLEPELRLLYAPGDAAVALEVKNSGSFGGGTLRKVTHDFRLLREAGIRCAYVTLDSLRDARRCAAPTHCRVAAQVVRESGRLWIRIYLDAGWSQNEPRSRHPRITSP